MKNLKEQKQTKLTKKEPDPKRRKTKKGKRLATKKKNKRTIKYFIRKLPNFLKYLLSTIILIILYTGLLFWIILKSIYKFLRFISKNTFKYILKPTFKYIKKNLLSVLILIIMITLIIIGRNYIIKLEEQLNNFNERINSNQENEIYTQNILQKQIDDLKTDLEGKTNELQEKDTKIKELEKKITSRGGYSRTTGTSNANTIVSGSVAEYQAYAKDLCINTYGWSESDFECLVKLWNRESNWNPNSHNSSSGAHGIPQSLPASKMASEGEDYYTNGYTQIRWGLKYIKNRYGNPTEAWQHSQNTGWY